MGTIANLRPLLTRAAKRTWTVSMTTSSNAQREKWGGTWKDIIAGGALRWKEHEAGDFDQKHADMLVAHGLQWPHARVLIPLAGDCRFVPLAVQSNAGAVHAVELVPEAAARLRERIEGALESKRTFGEPEPVADAQDVQKFSLTGEGSRVSVFVANVLEPISSLIRACNVIYGSLLFQFLFLFLSVFFWTKNKQQL